MSVQIGRAVPDSAEAVAALARLLWLDSPRGANDQPADLSLTRFTAELEVWWRTHELTHFPFVATVLGEVIGMAWVAIVHRVARPGDVDRASGDIQAVFVHPDHRGAGIGAALVDAAAAYAEGRGCGRVTVHSGRRAVPLYDRLGFAESPQLRMRPKPAND